MAIHGPANTILEKDFIFVYGLVCMVYYGVPSINRNESSDYTQQLLRT